MGGLLHGRQLVEYFLPVDAVSAEGVDGEVAHPQAGEVLEEMGALAGVHLEIARRLVDFLSGVAYANGGQIKKVANSTYIITPYNVGVMGDSLLDELENSGLYL